MSAEQANSARARIRRRAGNVPSETDRRVSLEPHHRDVRGGAARAAVFGVSDGLVSNVSLILGVAGAHPAASVVRLAGVAGLVAGACSMAAGEYVSMKAQAELLQRELAMERLELSRNPAYERRELETIYQQRGLDAEAAHDLAGKMMADPDTALETHAREELGIDPSELGSPMQAAASSFGAVAVGAFVPLLPWLVTSGATAVVLSIVLALVLAIAVGAALSHFTGRSVFRSVLRQVAVSAGAAAITFGIGSLFHVSGA